MERIDPRIIRTKKLLIKSFKVLSEKKAFDSITVTAITEQATVNRATFYYHFDDKEDLVEYILDEDLRLYLKNPLVNCKGVDADTLEKIFMSLVKYQETFSSQCEGNYRYFKKLLDQKIAEALIEQIHQLLNIEESNHTLDQPQIAALILSWGMYGLLNKWEENPRLDPKELISEATPSLLASIEAV